jgi:ribosomal protein S18 acetylase RimI-like enzyme
VTAHIRPYRDNDVDRLKEITAICFDGVSIDRNIQDRLGIIGGHDWRWRKLRHIDADVAREHAAGVLVSEIDGEVVGYITTRLDQESKIGWIPNLSVLPVHQGRGLGRQLMQAALAHLRAAGMECAKIEALVQNEVGTRFYPDMGFEEVARQIHYVMRL